MKIFSTEPVGSVMPKFPTGESGRSYTSNSHSSLTLLCPAQSYPVPVYRYEMWI